MLNNNVLNKDEIRNIFLNNGFKIKEGEIDLLPYVYLAADSLINKTVEKLILQMKANNE